MPASGDTPSCRLESLTLAAVSALSVVFLLRVAGQAIQRWFPVEFLPPFEAWQGSGLPYSVLLACQIVTLALLTSTIRGMVRQRRVLSATASRCVVVIGFVYFSGMGLRLILGVTLFDGNRWFTAWISAALHLDLAAIVILWGWDQLRRSRTMPA